MDLLQALTTAPPSYTWVWWVCSAAAVLTLTLSILAARNKLDVTSLFLCLVLLTVVSFAGTAIVADGQHEAYVADREQAITTYLDQERDLSVVADIVEHEPGPQGTHPPITTIAADRDGVRYDVTIIFPKDTSDTLTVAAVPLTNATTQPTTN